MLTKRGYCTLINSFRLRNSFKSNALFHKDPAGGGGGSQYIQGLNAH